MAAIDPPAPVAPSISVIVPVLHDAPRLEGLLSRLPGRSRCEVIVANGDAGDAAVRRLRGTRRDVVWVESEPGRGRQMNAGARGGGWLRFLPPTRCRRGRADEIARAIGRPVGVLPGLASTPPLAGAHIEAGVRWRVRWLGVVYGDQAIFVRRDLFRRLGGYPPIPVMEDADLVARIRARGRFWRSTVGVTVSARRWERDGWWRRTAANLRILVLHLAGRSPERLAAMYPAWRDSGEDVV